ncbi:MAG: amino acid deaminase/aldolase, partial [Bacteroidetes bacterium]
MNNEDAFAKYQAWNELVAPLPRPCALVDLDAMNANILAVKERAHPKKVRLATKSVRCVRLLEHLLQSEPLFEGLMAWHPLEAVFLSQRGFDDILVAYPCMHAEALDAVARENQRGKHLVLTVDCEAHVARIEQVAARSGVTIPICIDVDMSSRWPGLHFGVRRSPLWQPEEVRRLAERIQASPFLYLDGLLTYEAQIAGLPDRLPSLGWKRWLVPWLKRLSRAEVQRRRQAVVHAVADFNLRFVNAGGTGSLATSAAEPWVTEVTAGSAFFAPAQFDYYAERPFVPAAFFALEIVRQPRPGIVVCQMGGYVASGPPAWERLPRPWLPAELELLPDEGAGEVQTPLRLRAEWPLELGDVVFFRHFKAGELCEHFSHLYLVQDGRIVDRVPTYRGE